MDIKWFKNKNRKTAHCAKCMGPLCLTTDIHGQNEQLLCFHCEEAIDYIRQEEVFTPA